MAGASPTAERDKAGGGIIPVADFNKQLNSICKIECRVNGRVGGGTGFIGCIQDLLVLVTCNHVIPTAEDAESASFTFGYKEESKEGTKIEANDLLDVKKQWKSHPSLLIDQVGLDFTMIAVKEAKIKELNINPFDLNPAAVAEDDQLMIPQHPLNQDSQQQTPMGISLGPCKKIMGFLLFYDCRTFNGSSGSPVVKVIDGKLHVVAIHRGLLHGTFYNCSTTFTDVLSHFNDKEVPKVAKDKLLEFAGKVKWKPVEMFDLLKVLQPLSADWEELAFNLIKKDRMTVIGLVKGIKADCFRNAANDTGLRRVVEKWLGRTTRDKRTWKTLLDTAKMVDEHELSKYLEENGISSNDEPQMPDVLKWCRVSSCRSDWYMFACALLSREEARAIESNLQGSGTKGCLKKLIVKWMGLTPNPSWDMIVNALTQLPDATEVREKIIDGFKKK